MIFQKASISRLNVSFFALLAYCVLLSPASSAEYWAYDHKWKKPCDGFEGMFGDRKCREVPGNITNCKKYYFSRTKTQALADSSYAFEYLEKRLQIRNSFDWPVEQVSLLYKSISGVIEYEMKLDRLKIAPKKSAIISGMPKQVYKIIGVTVSSPIERNCSQYLSDAEIAEKELNQKKAEKEAIIWQKEASQRQIAKLNEERIFTNCIADKLPPNSEKLFRQSVISICERASTKPTIWNKIWYDYLGQ